MKLSIVTINYNNAEGLRRTLASVAAQTYSDIEHIIVDAASTDGSVEVIRDHESANRSSVHPLTIVWSSKKDKGIYNGMNIGIQRATGDYIQILNSGDILASPDVTERMMNALIEASPQQCSTDGHRQSDRAELFTREGKGDYSAVKPKGLHNFSLYLGGKWYSLTAKEGRYDDSDPIGVLDVTISSNLILDKILGIKDLRSDKRIEFVGGIRGLGELQRRVDSGEMKVALALYPVTMQQIIDIADSGNIMPPKTTWFEPKLRSGLVIHALE